MPEGKGTRVSGKTQVSVKKQSQILIVGDTDDAEIDGDGDDALRRKPMSH